MLQLTGAILALAIVSCSTPGMILDPDIQHKKDLAFCVKDVACFKGAGVVPSAPEYKLEIGPRNEDNIDRIVFASCHRTNPFYNEELPKVDLPFFGAFFGKKKRGISWDYRPTPGLEDTGDCDLYIYALDFESEDHAWAIMRTEHFKYKLEAILFCNGDGGKDYNGVSVCDAKAGTFQRMEFVGPVNIKTSKSCPMPEKMSEGIYQIKIQKGKCPYLITSLLSKEKHSMLLFGWESFKFEKR